MYFNKFQCKQKGFAPISVLIPILILAVLGGLYYFGKLPIKLTNNNPKACTQEAKQCSDGTSVGRTGPNCEFAPCPSASPKPSDETANWKTYTNTKLGVSFKIPNDWEAQEFDLSVNPGMEDISMGFKGRLRTITLSVSTEQMDAFKLKRPYTIVNEIYSVDEVVTNSRGYTFTEYTLTFKKSLEGNKSVVEIIEFNNKVVKWELIDISLRNFFDQILSTFKFIP